MGTKTRLLQRTAKSFGRVAKSNKRYVLFAFGTSWDLGPKVHWASAEAKLYYVSEILRKPLKGELPYLLARHTRLLLHQRGFFEHVSASDEQQAIWAAELAQFEARMATEDKAHAIELKRKRDAATREAIELLSVPFSPDVVYRRPPPVVHRLFADVR